MAAIFSDAKSTVADVCEFCLDGGVSVLGAGLTGWLVAQGLDAFAAPVPDLAEQVVAYGAAGAGFAYTWPKMRGKKHLTL